jgi:hypothetical protein
MASLYSSYKRFKPDTSIRERGRERGREREGEREGEREIGRERDQ